MNLATILIASAVAVLFVVLVVNEVRKRKQGQCSGNCASCHGNCNCQK